MSLMHGPCSKLKTPEDLGINRFREYTPPEKEKERERETQRKIANRTIRMRERTRKGKKEEKGARSGSCKK